MSTEKSLTQGPKNIEEAVKGMVEWYNKQIANEVGKQPIEDKKYITKLQETLRSQIKEDKLSPQELKNLQSRLSVRFDQYWVESTKLGKSHYTISTTDAKKLASEVADDLRKFRDMDSKAINLQIGSASKFLRLKGYGYQGPDDVHKVTKRMELKILAETGPIFAVLGEDFLAELSTRTEINKALSSAARIKVETMSEVTISKDELEKLANDFVKNNMDKVAEYYALKDFHPDFKISKDQLLKLSITGPQNQYKGVITEGMINNPEKVTSVELAKIRMTNPKHFEACVEKWESPALLEKRVLESVKTRARVLVQASNLEGQRQGPPKVPPRPTQRVPGVQGGQSIP
ncbi:MAG UNVERIFIED_CONTAM: hypothetical protein LVR18_03420 [Planctomycetaceae bacterium]|jgi:DNA primase